MGQIDTTLRYNGIYNSYEMGANDTLHATIFDTQYLSHITTQFVAVRVSGTIVDGWIEAIWIDANGAQVGSTQTVTWTPTRLWKRYTHTFAVPTGAVKVKLTYKSGAAGYHFSCPMTEAGEIASAYNAQTAAQLAYHTAQGSYVGFLNAGQIVAGLLRSVDGKAGFDLDKPEIYMQGNDAKWKASPSNPLELTDKNGNFIGGLKKLANKIALVAGLVSNDPTLSTYAEIGYPSAGGSGLNIVAMDGSSAYISPYGTYFVIMVDGTQRLALYKDGGFVLWDENQVARLYLTKDGDFVVYDDNVARLNLTEDGDFVVYDGNGTARLYFTEDGSFHVNDGISSVSRIQVYPNGPAGITSENGNTLGIDDTGAYKIINGTKTYI